MSPCTQVFALAFCSLVALGRSDDDVTLLVEPEEAVKGTMLFQAGQKVTSVPGARLSSFDKFADLDDDLVNDLLQEDPSPSEAVSADAFADIDEILIGHAPAKSTKSAKSSWQLHFPRVISCSTFWALFQDMFFLFVGVISYYIWKCCHYTLPDINMLRAMRRPSCSATGAAVSSSTSSIDTDELVQAMYTDNKEHLQKLLEERSTEATEEVWGCTALHVAAHCNNAPAAEALLLRGASSNMKDTWDETPLHFAARSGSTEVCDLLLAYGADVNAVNARDWTPLVVAAHAGKEEVCRLLLSHGAGVAGLADADLPPLLSALLVQRVFEASEQSVSATKCKDA